MLKEIVILILSSISFVFDILVLCVYFDILHIGDYDNKDKKQYNDKREN